MAQNDNTVITNKLIFFSFARPHFFDGPMIFQAFFLVLAAIQIYYLYPAMLGCFRNIWDDCFTVVRFMNNFNINMVTIPVRGLEELGKTIETCRETN